MPAVCSPKTMPKLHHFQYFPVCSDALAFCNVQGKIRGRYHHVNESNWKCKRGDSVPSRVGKEHWENSSKPPNQDSGERSACPFALSPFKLCLHLVEFFFSFLQKWIYHYIVIWIIFPSHSILWRPNLMSFLIFTRCIYFPRVQERPSNQPWKNWIRKTVGLCATLCSHPPLQLPFLPYQ